MIAQNQERKKKKETKYYSDSCDVICVYVMTEGDANPVNAMMSLICNPTATSGSKANEVDCNNSFGFDSYFSKYTLTVAPLPAVPDKRKTTREPSTNKIRIP